MLISRRLYVATMLLVAAGAGPLRAQDTVPGADSVRATKPYVFGLTANSMTIDGTTAGTQLVGARSWGLQVDAGALMKHFYMGVDFGPQFLSDRATFTQSTTGGDMKSTATLLYFSAMAGPRTPSFQLLPGVAPMSLGVYGGVSGTSSQRSIENCTNCYSQAIDIPGGPFVQPILLFGAGRTRVRVSDRVFLGGKGITSVMSAGMEIGPQ